MTLYNKVCLKWLTEAFSRVGNIQGNVGINKYIDRCCHGYSIEVET